MPDAHPFSYVECLSPHLNLYGEPEPFLPEADRPAFEPIAFFGSLDSRAVSFDCTSYPKPRPPDRPRVFVSFGTVVWRYFAPIAIQALEVLADVLGSLDVEAVVSVGGYDLTAADGRIPSKPNVRVERYVDQWAVLSRSDLFVTHHGLNSTHESIFLEVPMLSYPFFGDQPALARRCQELGVALPIAATPRAPLAAGDVLAAIERVRSEHELFARHLAEARAWELDTIAGRGAVLDRLEALARG